MKAISKKLLFQTLPPVWPEDLKPRIRKLIADSSHHKIVVLDDDPTGTQTVYDLPILTSWTADEISQEFQREGHCFYILTNTRSMVEEDARALLQEVSDSIQQALNSSKRPISLIPITRSDSTLRGHYPMETDVFDQEFGAFDATFIIPYFEAGGRYTIHNVHYVAEGDTLTPAACTPFAKDAVFGYQNSHLYDWIEEKTQGKIKAQDVASISLETIRTGGPEAVFEELMSLPKHSVCVVNSAALQDLDVFALGMLMAEAMGKKYLFRSAAQIIAARLGLALKPLLTAEDLITNGKTGGLTIVGSYVPKTTEQVSHLLSDSKIQRIELSVSTLLDSTLRGPYLAKAELEIHEALRAGHDMVVYTSRDLIIGDDAEQNLNIGNSVSSALVQIVQSLTLCPRYLIAKGGITSSDLAVKGLGVKRSIVLGQILPGIPVWRIGAETKFPNLPYIVFPGNVGSPTALLDVVAKLRSSIY